MLIAGIDEVGRGPLAGPVVACAVILHPDRPIAGLRDSKKLSAKKRIEFTQIIKQQALSVAVGHATVAEIDRLNIHHASLLAMRRAFAKLTVKANKVLVDGKHCPQLECKQIEAIIKGDETVPVISAASIIAKVARDNYMLKMDAKYPEYGFAKHMGYPTKAHLDALEMHGITPIHRRSYKPVARLITNVETV